MTTRNPSMPESEYEHTLTLYRAGSIPESAWQEHLQDKGFREWVNERLDAEERRESDQ